MAIVKWKKDKVLSIKLRNGKYALFQMLEGKCQIAVFNSFQDQNDWKNTVLTKESVLFYTNIIPKSVLSRSEITVQKTVPPAIDLEFPKFQLNTGHGNRKIKIWKNTPYERELIIMGEGSNLLAEERFENEIIYTSIEVKEYKKYRHLELENIRIYPEFNERLYLCSEMNKNIDPLKELAFDQDLDLRCQTYIDIISGKVRLESLGY
uniref:Uncharacterized protein n=1 Tax=Roseihalotalea indica TaxID=2867963 RepID=A0AA49GRZ4_9BACT|nr:hypothetical protein K4G66_00800 [Tunicatimonas sp. TK19036]